MNWGRGRSSGSQGDCAQCVLHHLVCRRYQSGVLPHWMGGGGGGGGGGYKIYTGIYEVIKLWQQDGINVQLHVL